MNGLENGRNELLIRTERVSGAEVQASFRDTGVGVEPSKVDQIFGAFYTTKGDGMGMGLWISRSIVGKHGGRLWRFSPDHSASDHALSARKGTVVTYDPQSQQAGSSEKWLRAQGYSPPTSGHCETQ